jgi:hypothetical protein
MRGRVTAIGGFFELEPQRCQGVWHEAAVALTSGRACFRAILERARPARVLVPFYLCDAALEPLRLLNIPFDFYPLTESLAPDLQTWPAAESALCVNYFGLQNRMADAFADALGGRGMVDDTQSFFSRGRGRAWSFNSARKFFGVPDGAYVYGPDATSLTPRGVNDSVLIAHLTTRMTGPQDVAYQQYVEAERSVSSDVLAPSAMATRLLGGIAYEDARVARRRNYAQLHGRLSANNALRIDFALGADAAPFCYPFLPARASLHRLLWQREIYVPRLWPEVESRDADGFVWERDLASRLLPLPVDQRYGPGEMDRVADAVLEVAA